MKKLKQTKEQILLWAHLGEVLPDETLEIEHRFALEQGRNWRFDVAVPRIKLGLEACGGMWTGGHQRGAALEDEYDKLNTAQMLGWSILFFSNEQINTGRAKEFIQRFLAYRALNRLRESLREA